MATKKLLPSGVIAKYGAVNIPTGSDGKFSRIIRGDTFEKIHKFILENSIHGELLITMGAGDVVKIGENLLGN